MSERKVLNKYYPPDFDPSKIPRMKLPKNRQYTVRLMAPFNMRCATCGEYIYKGKKFNARKEDVENEDYLGIRIYRFYIKCTRCLQEISFKTDPKNTDYEIEAGATRNFMALKLAEEQAQREEEELKEEEANNPMKLLENRTEQSKNEIELLESLEELKDLNRRQQAVDYDTMLMAYDTSITKRQLEEMAQQRDEEYIKTVKFHSSNQKRKFVVEEEVVEEESDIKVSKTSPTSSVTSSTERTNSAESEPQISSESTVVTKPIVKNTWIKSVGSLSKGRMTGLVKLKKSQNNEGEPQSSSSSSGSNSAAKNNDTKIQNDVSNSTVPVEKTATVSNSLSLLGAYSDSENSE